MSPRLDPELAEPLMRYISGARWFAGKGRLAELRSLTPLGWLSTPGEDRAWPAVRPEIAEIVYPAESAGQPATERPAPSEDGGPDPVDLPEADDTGTPAGRELYQLAVSYRPAPVAALHHAEIGRFTDHELGPVVAYDAMQDPEACRVVLESLLDERRLREGDSEVRFRLSSAEGLHADLEPRIFTGQQSNTSVMFGDVAMLKLFRRLEIGRNLDIEVHDALGRAGVADVAGLFGWVEADWAFEGETLDTDLAMVVEKLASAEDGWGLALDTLRAGESFADRARALGSALAEIHTALRAAFPTASVPGASVAAVMRQRLDRAAASAPALQPYADALAELFGDLDAATLQTQRVHGDFHLGQTLHTPDGWKIIDFEGEPAKTLVERMEPDSVWRDIAGMLRSFDYAAASVPGPESAAWAAQCRDAFLAGYADGGLSASDAVTLRAYEADKAVYEVVYEVRNRPDWVAIPLAAVATLAVRDRTDEPSQTQEQE